MRRDQTKQAVARNLLPALPMSKPESSISNPAGWTFYDNASKREMRLVYDEASSWKGWLIWQHPDGQWVSLRKATLKDYEALSKAVAGVLH